MRTISIVPSAGPSARKPRHLQHEIAIPTAFAKFEESHAPTTRWSVEINVINVFTRKSKKSRPDPGKNPANEPSAVFRHLFNFTQHPIPAREARYPLQARGICQVASQRAAVACLRRSESRQPPPPARWSRILNKL